MEILAIIPARAGSKRIPDKNIKELGGRPLIEWSIISAAACEQIDHIVITSNLPALRRYEGKFGHLSYLDRPEFLCEDEVGDLAVIAHVIDNYNSKWDLIVYLRPTTPFRAIYHLDTAISHMIAADCNATGLRSVELMAESAYKCFELPAFLSPIAHYGKDLTDYPNQLGPQTYRPNGYIDICKPEIVKRGKLWGDWVIGYVTPHAVEIDTPDDWDYAEWKAGRMVEQNLRFGVKSV